MLVALFLLVCAVSPAAAEQPAEYTLGPEDVINVVVLRHPEFSGDFHIPPDGNINLPAVGQVAAAGKTLAEMTKTIAQRLGDRLRDPEVTVALRTPRTQRIFVLGAVAKPGPYDGKDGWRITEAIAAAGGLAPGFEPPDLSVIVLSAATGSRQSVGMVEVLRGSSDANKLISSGDVVTVEAPETLPVYVSGRVRSPGLYRLRKDSPGLVEALTLAGGPLEDAALQRVAVSRTDGTTQTVDLAPAMLEGKPQTPVVLKSGDLVVVPEAVSRVAVLGYVNEPGFYQLRGNQKVNLVDAVGMAKGIDNKRGDMGKVAVIRASDSKREALVYDLRKFLKSGDLSQNPEIGAGDVVFVPQTGKPDWNTVLSALTTALYLAPLF